MTQNPLTPANTPPTPAPRAATAPTDPDYQGTDLISSGPSGIIALAAVIIGLFAVFLYFRKGLTGGVNGGNPPSVLGVNLSVCAALMGFLSLYRVRKLPSEKWTRIGSLAAILIGLAGPVIVAFQTVSWKRSDEFDELSRVQIIAVKAREFAQAHGGKFPSGFAPLVLAADNEPWHLPASALKSRYCNTTPLTTDLDTLRKLPPDQAESEIMKHSDFVYLGKGLPGDDKFAIQMDAGKIIIATSKQIGGAAFEERLKEEIPIAWANTDMNFVSNTALVEILKESNKARLDRGLPELDDYGNPKKR